MKRFFCTICGRVKRVRRLPRNTQQVNSHNPSLRQGTCDRHAEEAQYITRPGSIKAKVGA